MKKSARWIPIALSLLFVITLLGIFVYRQSNPSSISLHSNDAQIVADKDLPIVDGKININTASAEDFMLLPGIGQTLAKRIIDYREKYGPFSQLDDLKKVSGIGETRFNALLEYITVGQ